MAKIQTLYLVHHSHTDIGFTDYQDVVFRQHMEFIDKALDLCESTEDYPAEAQFKWVCEVTGMTERYLRTRPTRQVERFIKYHKQGRIDVAGMQYNLTPLLNVEQLHRSLYPVKRLREQYGIDLRVAMNCDVDGASWILADLLPAVGIELFTMAINPIRGRTPKPRPSAFWWEGPAGGRVLAWNGYHYLFGGLAGLGNFELSDKFIQQFVAKLEQAEDYPFDFLYGQTTNPIRVDNGFPDRRLSDFIRQWNDSGRMPRIELITVTKFNKILRSRYADQLRTMRGDWTDWWTDGVASSAFETGLNRGTHETLLAAEFVGAWLSSLGKSEWSPELVNEIYEYATLYDEHTWGAFSSVEAPNGLFSRSQWNRKAGYAYQAAANAHDLLARTARTLASQYAFQQDEVHFDLGQLPPEMAKPTTTYKELLIINPLPFARDLIVEEPVRRGGQAPAGMLEQYLPRGLTWGIQPDPEGRKVAATVPALGYAFVQLDKERKGGDIAGSGSTIENAFYRITVDPATGGLTEWYDKVLDHDFAGSYQGWSIGQYVYEWVDSPLGRDALFRTDWANEDFGVPPAETPFCRSTVADVELHAPVIRGDAVTVSATVRAKGIHVATCTYTLPSNQRSLEVRWSLHKEHVTEPEAVFFAFPFNLGDPTFLADVNGVPVAPNEDQLPGSVRDWYPIQRWVTVCDGTHGVTLVPVDAPLVHLGGITTGKWAQELQPESPTLMSWAMNNHWMVNFKASQGGEVPFRFVLTTYEGQPNVAHCSRFSSETVTNPIVLRDCIRKDGVPTEGQFLEVTPSDGVLVNLKPADDGRGIIARVQNVTDAELGVALRFSIATPRTAYLCDPVETDLREVPCSADEIKVSVAHCSIQSVRVLF